MCCYIPTVRIGQSRITCWSTKRHVQHYIAMVSEGNITFADRSTIKQEVRRARAITPIF